MNHAATISPPLGKRTPETSIAWEAPSSLQHLVLWSEAAPHDGDVPTWAATMPASLEAANSSADFHEALKGLSVRDIDEPEIFNVYFGAAAAPRRRAA